MSFLVSALGKYVIFGLVLAALGGTIYVQRLKLEARDATIAAYRADLDQAKKGIADAKAVNEENVTQLALVQADAERAIAAITADRDRLAAQAPEVKIVKEKIYVDAKACAGVPPAIRVAVVWLRGHPDAGTGGDHAAQGDTGAGAGGAAQLRP